MPKFSITLSTDHHHVDLPDRVGIRVLGAKERTVDGKTVAIAGRRLIVQIAEPIPAGEAIGVDGSDSLLLGEVLGCWREGSATLAAIEFQHALTRLSELARWVGEADPASVRLSA